MKMKEWLKNNKKIVIIAGAVMILLAVVLGGFILSQKRYVTVSFETAGGTAVESVRVEKGTRLEDLPMSYKMGHTFTGWCLDEQGQNQFYSSVTVENDMTLYAQYQEMEHEYVEYVPTEILVDDCETDYTFKITSEEEITNENLNKYLLIETFSGDVPELSVTKEGNIYTISPVNGYEAGKNYTATAMENVSFTDIGMDDIDLSELVTLNFSIFHEEEVTVVYKDGILYLDRTQAVQVQEGYYMVFDAAMKDIKVDSIVCLQDDTTDIDTFFKVVEIDPQGTYSMLTVEDCEYDDICEELEVYVTDIEMDMDAVLAQLDPDNLVESIKNSEGVQQLTYVLAGAIENSPTIQQMSGFADNSNFKDSLEITVDSLLDGMTVSAEIGSATNSTFNKFGISSNDWMGVKITIGYEAKIKNKVNVDIELEIAQFYKLLSSGSKVDKIANAYVDVYTQTDIVLSAYAYSADEGFEDAQKEEEDISAEIMLTLNGQGENTNIVEEMQELLKSSGNEIELVRVDLLTVPVNIGGIFSLNFELDFVVSIDFAAGVKAEFSYCTANRFGIEAELLSGNVTPYNEKLRGNSYCSFDMYAAGYIGMKAGLAGNVNISFVGPLAEYGKVGFELQVGFYLDIYGYMHYQFVTDQLYDCTGAMYIEPGLYVDLDLFVSSEKFRYRKELSVFSFKFPFASFGNKEAMIGIDIVDKNDSTPVLRGGSTYIGDLFTIEKKYMDITTGEITTKPYTGKVTIQFSEPNFRYGGSTIYFDNASSSKQCFYVTAYVYASDYTFSFLGGSRDQVNTTKMKMIWVPKDYTGEVLNQETVTATYEVQVEGKTVYSVEREVLKGSIAGNYNFAPLVLEDGKTGFYMMYDSDNGTWNMNPKKTAINEDTTFIYQTYMRQRKVGVVYSDGKQWYAEVYAVPVGQKLDIDVPEITGVRLVSWASNDTEVYRQAYGKPDGTIKPVLATGEVYPGIGYVYPKHVEDITKPLESTVFESGSEAYEYMLKQIWKHGTYADQVYLAEYEQIEYKLTFETLRGTFVKSYNYGDKAAADVYDMTSTLGYEFLGWDANGDGVVDYQSTELPDVIESRTYKAIYEKKTYGIMVYDAYGNSTNYEDVALGEDLSKYLTQLEDIEDVDAQGNVKGIHEFKGWNWRHMDAYTGVFNEPILLKDFKGVEIVGNAIYYPCYVYTTETDVSSKINPKALNIIAGNKIDIIDTVKETASGKKVDGYFYDMEKGLLYITGNDLILTGVAKDITIVIGEQVERITLANLSIEANPNRNYRLTSVSVLKNLHNLKEYSWANNYNYALIRVLASDLDMTIIGDVSLTKTAPKDSEGYLEDCVAILNIANVKEVNGESVEILTNLRIHGNSSEDKLQLDAGEGIRYGGNVEVSNMSLTITSLTYGMTGNDVTIKNTHLTTKTSDPENMEIAVVAGENLVIADCVLDVSGRLQSECMGEDVNAITIIGNTSGEIRANEFSALNLSANFEDRNKKIYIGLNGGCELKLSMGSIESVICTGDCSGLVLEGATLSHDSSMKQLEEGGWYYLVDSEGNLIRSVTITGIR